MGPLGARSRPRTRKPFLTRGGRLVNDFVVCFCDLWQLALHLYRQRGEPWHRPPGMPSDSVRAPRRGHSRAPRSQERILCPQPVPGPPARAARALCHAERTRPRWRWQVSAGAHGTPGLPGPRVGALTPRTRASLLRSETVTCLNSGIRRAVSGAQQSPRQGDAGAPQTPRAPSAPRSTSARFVLKTQQQTGFSSLPRGIQRRNSRIAP